MKGITFSVELLAMVILAIITVGVLYFLFSGTGEVQPASQATVEVECRSHSDCSNNPNGKLCLSIQSSPTFCGCLDDIDCNLGSCVNNLCVIPS